MIALIRVSYRYFPDIGRGYRITYILGIPVFAKQVGRLAVINHTLNDGE